MTNMPVRSAEIIDFQEYRDARNAERTTVSTDDAPRLLPVMTAMVWVPVWFVPARFVGTPTAG